MNRKGFTLIELLAVIVIIGILGVLIVPGILNNVTTAKETAYNTLIKNVVTSAQMYYEECEYGDLNNEDKYGIYTCNITNNSIVTNLSALANTGFLKVNNTKTLEDGSIVKIILNPINNNDISSCNIKITKIVDNTTFKVIYNIENISTDDTCPDIYN